GKPFVGEIICTGVFADVWKVKVEYEMEALVSSCVVVPCSFTYPAQQQPSDRIRAMWHMKDKWDEIIFHKDSTRVLDNFKGRTKLLGSLGGCNCTLEIDEVRNHDNGPYCFRVELETSVKDKYSFVDNCVSFKMIEQASKPELQAEQSVQEGEPAVFKCSVRYTCPSHQPTLTWSHPGKIIMSYKDIGRGKWEAESLLTFTPTKEDDHSDITCTVKYHGNVKGEMTTTRPIFVKEQANFHFYMQSHIFIPIISGLGAALLVGLLCFFIVIRYVKRIADLQSRNYTGHSGDTSSGPDCVKFCGAFELALRGHDESQSSDNPGIFHGLVDFVAALDAVLKEHLENVTVFKGTSKTVQNELLDCMLSVVREHIIKEAQSSDFLSIQADETTDVATQCQLVLVLRYIDAKSNIQESFFAFIPLHSATADSISTALKEHLAVIIPEDQKSKLLSQACDGASVMRGATAGVQRKIQDVYPNAHYIHCYAHQLNLIMQQATSHIPKVRIFFSDLGGFASFFSRSPKRTDVLDKVVARRLPTSSSVRWNFHSRAVNTVFEQREDLIRCFEMIRDSSDFDPVTKKEIDSVHIKKSIQQFQEDIQKIRNSLHSLVDQSNEGGGPQPKRRRSLSPEVHKRIAAEICDTILAHTMERFSFTNHLVSATLLQADRFERYTLEFPENALSMTLKAYPVLNGNKLKTPRKSSEPVVVLWRVEIEITDFNMKVKRCNVRKHAILQTSNAITKEFNANSSYKLLN
ncbi:hypothetical protein QQF64_008937, partial [Cirrhinus molitorella]